MAPGATPSLIGAPTSAASGVPGEDVGETVVVDASAAARWELALDHGPTYQLIGTTIVLGRKPEGSDPSIHYLAVRDATRTLSKVHARLERDGESWRVRDLGSTNGVRVIDADGSEHPVVPDDGVELAGRDFVLGRVTMRIERLGGPAVPEEPRDESEWPTGERA
ncbi:FHA domain-containing protein [Schumannella sp. 10F1B-5-1]|nr:FHA domain-containing protein [Schumannella sp. 10F1B-5-1]